VTRARVCDAEASVIRRATVADAATIVAIHRASRSQAYAHLGTPEQAAGSSTAESWAAILGEATVWVYERAGTILGFASLHDAILTGLYVLPEAQNAGIGAALLAEAVEGGARELWVYADHPQARAFYERHGWRVAGEPAVSDEDWALPVPALRYVLA
jgi:GNAT superfamily N-acetyltransferase